MKMTDSSVNNENKEFQNDELNALAAIYGDEFVLDEFSSNLRACSINLRSSLNSDNWAVFKIRLPPDYPTNSPPIFELNCPFMSSIDKENLSFNLQSIYLANINQPVLYLWVEAVKNKLDDLDQNISPLNSSRDEKNEHFDAAAACAEFSTSSNGKNDLELPEIVSGPTITDRKSTFQAHLATPLVCKDQVGGVLRKLRENSKIARATHNMYAFRIKTSPVAGEGDTNRGGAVIQDCEDDGEHQAGGRLLHLLEMMDAANVLVVVSRWYGGVHLGPDRFKHINNAARILLEQQGFGQRPKQQQQEKTSKRHPKK